MFAAKVKATESELEFVDGRNDSGSVGQRCPSLLSATRTSTVEAERTPSPRMLSAFWQKPTPHSAGKVQTHTHTHTHTHSANLCSAFQQRTGLLANVPQ